MRKFMNWMFAAILICGSSAVMSSCGDDDNDNEDKGKQLTPNTYEVTLSWNMLLLMAIPTRSR